MTTIRKARRSQAERLATTRRALLDATVELVAERGYAGTSTAEIAQRAHVTRGAQTRHFANKAELVTESIRHLTAKIVQEHRRQSTLASTGPRTIENALDDLWSLHRSPAFAAAIDLWSAARTDSELRLSLASLEHEVTSAIRDTISATVPAAVDSPHLISTTTATMRGIALLGFVHDDIEAEWRAARQHLLELWSGVANSD